MGMYGVPMPREPKIMKMDWKSLGYERIYVDGRVKWIPKEQYKAPENQDTSS
jgi:hypothetical protein